MRRMRAIDRLAPAALRQPGGKPATRSTMPRPAGPTVEVRAQALYGLANTSDGRGRPRAADPRHHLARARPIQTTRDLPAFWAGSWRDVAKEMRGRYPNHPWPDDPAAAPPTLRTKRASAFDRR